MKIFKLPTNRWFIERILFLIAGSFVLISVVLSVYVSLYFLIFTIFVGAMQLIFALSGYCPMAILLHWLNVQEK